MQSMDSCAKSPAGIKADRQNITRLLFKEYIGDLKKQRLHPYGCIYIIKCIFFFGKVKGTAITLGTRAGSSVTYRIYTGDYGQLLHEKSIPIWNKIADFSGKLASPTRIFPKMATGYLRFARDSSYSRSFL